ncbi:hypothetical protein FRC12_002246 [Ceratobasidium sp. 428]|nr:hypothetical protein FRC12_002246 [Ceratobasidium sp. 428]
MFTLFATTLGLALQASAQYTATYDPTNLPPKTEQDQIGTNQCGTKASQDSLCQNVFVNSVNDFCLWAPPYSNGHNSSVGDVEQIMVSWCMNDGYGTRLIPDGTIKGAHFVQTPDYVQVTGWGDFTKMNIPARDTGGELDPHGADGMGNPHGGLVFSNSFGKWEQFHEWNVSFFSYLNRACSHSPLHRTLCRPPTFVSAPAAQAATTLNINANISTTCKAATGTFPLTIPKAFSKTARATRVFLLASMEVQHSSRDMVRRPRPTRSRRAASARSTRQ